MKWIYLDVFIKNNEFIFYGFIALILTIMIITAILVNKELKTDNENK